MNKAEIIREDRDVHYGKQMFLRPVGENAVFAAEYLRDEKVLVFYWPSATPVDHFVAIVEKALGHSLDWEQEANALSGKVNKDVFAAGRFSIETRTSEGLVPRAGRSMEISTADSKSLKELVKVAKATVNAPSLLPKRALGDHLGQYIQRCLQ